MTTEPEAARDRRASRLTIALLGVGLCGLVVSVALRFADAQSAASQDWSPFVLVTGLLLIGHVADQDGLFVAAGARLARASSSGAIRFAGSVVVIGVVTATLNLDTAVAFLTPVFVHAERARGERNGPLLYATILLANAGSLLLPGSNLTNLIVLDRVGGESYGFISHLWAPALVALVVSALVVALFERSSLRSEAPISDSSPRPTIGVGCLAVVAAVVLVVSLRAPALPVAVVGVVAVTIRITARRATLSQVVAVVNAPVVIGLFGVAVTCGVIGRWWSGPATLLAHCDLWTTGAFAAVATVAINNLPAASLLAARIPRHPYALLIGLNLGPNLAVTGSLAWILWLRAARTAGATPSISRASLVGGVASICSIAAALAVLAARW